MPSTRLFGGDLVFGDHFLAPESVAGGGDSDAFFHGIKVSLLFEFFAESSATCFEEFDIGFAVRFHLAFEDETVVGCDFFCIPSFELGLLFGGHTNRIVVGDVRRGSIILLVFQGVEFMREESLAQFIDTRKWLESWPEEMVEIKHNESLKVNRSDVRDRILVSAVIWSVTSRCVA